MRSDFQTILGTIRSKQLQTLVSILLFLCPSLLLADKESSNRPTCEAPEYFGVCDPFVPGTYISGGTNKPIIVFSTWPGGPAERAGICPGDKIIAANGISALENTIERMLEEIVSDSATPVLLKVRRGEREIEFRVPRVRESTLAKLSKQKFALVRGFRGQDTPSTVPLDQTLGGLGELEGFHRRIDARYGFKKVGNFTAPMEAPEEQIKRVLKLPWLPTQSERFVGWTYYFRDLESYSAGFIALLLKNPEEVWVRHVFPNSPAHRAGLFPGDRLVEVDGRTASGLTQEDLGDLLAQSSEPRQISLKVSRGGSTVSLVIETKRARGFIESNFHIPLLLFSRQRRLKGDDYILGIQALHAENPREAILQRVRYPSPAFDAGLHLGDLLLSIQGKPIQDISRDELGEFLQQNKPSEIVLKVLRLGEKLTFRVTLTRYKQALAKIGRKLMKNGTPAPQHCPEPATPG